MSDDKSKIGEHDRQRTGPSEAYEVRDWSEKFGPTPEELKAVVQAVGDKVAAVEAHLKGVKP